MITPDQWPHRVEAPMDPSALLFYSLKWRAGDEPYLEDGETITSSVWKKGEEVIETSAVYDDDTTVLVSDNTGARTIEIRNFITTSNGREDVRSLVINMRRQ